MNPTIARIISDLREKSEDHLDDADVDTLQRMAESWEECVGALRMSVERDSCTIPHSPSKCPNCRSEAALESAKKVLP